MAVSSGEKLLEVSAFDRILVVRHSGMYSVVPVSEKLFVDQGLQWVAVANKEEISSTPLTIIYRAAGTGFPYIKRTSIETWIIGKDYSLIPEGAQMLLFSTEKDFEFTLSYAKKPRTKKNEETFKTKNYMRKGMKSAGQRLATREVLEAVSSARRVKPTGPNEPELIPEADFRLEGDAKPVAPAKTKEPTKSVNPKPARKKRETPKPAEERPHGLLAALARKKAEQGDEEKKKPK